jgi:N-acyl homoserine lactone hydrolase
VAGAGESQIIEIHRLHLTDVTPAPYLPWTRPTFPVFAYLVMHATGPMLIDTGVGVGSALIDELYSPIHHDLDEAVERHGVRVDDITTVITSHLHFDHCGQNNRFARSTIFVQRAEVEAATAEMYTVPEWAFPPGVDLTVIDGDHQVASDVTIVSTPGHTPGHQSVLMSVTAHERSCAVRRRGTRTALPWQRSAMTDGTKPWAPRRSKGSMHSSRTVCC